MLWSERLAVYHGHFCLELSSSGMAWEDSCRKRVLGHMESSSVTVGRLSRPLRACAFVARLLGSSSLLVHWPQSLIVFVPFSIVPLWSPYSAAAQTDRAAGSFPFSLSLEHCPQASGCVSGLYMAGPPLWGLFLASISASAMATALLSNEGKGGWSVGGEGVCTAEQG